MALSVLSGETVRHAAEVFRVSVALAVKWTQRHRMTGGAAAKAMGSRRRDVMAAFEGTVLEPAFAVWPQ